jgi:hypothetical protein
MSNIIFDNNIEALKKKGFPCESILEQKDKYEIDNTFEFVEAKDKNLILKYKNDKEVYFNSTYRPIEEAKKWAEQYRNKEKNKVSIIYGFGSGYQVEELVEDLTENDIMIVYEPSINIFIKLLLCRDITHLIANEQVIIIVNEINDDKFRRYLSIEIKWFNLERTKIIDLPQYLNIFSEQYDKVLSDFKKEVVAQVGNTATLIARAKDRIGNIICNLQQFKRINTINELIGKFNNDIPFIVVSAGPSLIKNIDILHEAKGKAFICATDTAAKVMLKHNIIPDVYVCVDPIKFDILEIDDERVWDIPVVCSVTSHYKLLRESKGKIILFNEGHEIVSRLIKGKGKECDALGSGGSVAHNAFALGRFLNFKRIVLIGQDLAFTNNKTHIEGAFSDLSVSTQTKENEIYVEDINGDMVLTRFDFKAYLDWFEREIHALKDEVEVIDATEGGAKIHGTEIMTLREVIDKYCIEEDKVSEIINEMDNLFSEKDYDFIDKEISKLKTRICTLAKKAKKAKVANIKRYDYFTKKMFGNSKFIKAEDDLEKLDKYINNSPDMVFIDDLIIGSEYIMVSESSGLAADDPEAIKKRVENKNTLYDQIDIAVKRVLATFESVESGKYFEEENYGVIPEDRVSDK